MRKVGYAAPSLRCDSHAHTPCAANPPYKSGLQHLSNTEAYLRSSFHSQAAPRTPLESPCWACSRRVLTWSENT